ncbi:hypothetical protein PRIPAC_74643 [Pristionchus pacificus]|uniref:Uncharacterized protein n=1 Tax=Pristionchus pacificus TaxID=54126 RepID=A0A2A6C042_PRIPA|nr:hypothetical protein PRIPAC_74643 [Pristionchus pacificus]|eukprot:PDM71479.1 hypothetical protein PRIPAC_37886 [Pristionchus pacificus]
MRMTMGIVIFHIDVPLAPDGVTSKTVFPDSLTVISIEFYLGSQTRLIFAFILTEEFWKNCFRRHAIWSQRDVDMKNDYAHRHPHPREPQTTYTLARFERINVRTQLPIYDEIALDDIASEVDIMASWIDSAAAGINNSVGSVKKSLWGDSAEEKKGMGAAVAAGVKNATVGVFRQINTVGEPIFKHVRGSTLGWRQMNEAGKGAIYKPASTNGLFSSLGWATFVGAAGYDLFRFGETAKKDYDEGGNYDKSTVMGASIVGAWAGAINGGAVGASTLSVVPGVGTVVGGVAGGVLGAVYGAKGGEALAKALLPEEKRKSWMETIRSKFSTVAMAGALPACNSPILEPHFVSGSGIAKDVWKACVVVSAVTDAYELVTAINKDNAEGTHHNTVHASAEIVGSWTGVLYGAKLGASVGENLFENGTLIGGIVGGIIGTISGSFLARTLAEKVLTVVSAVRDLYAIGSAVMKDYDDGTKHNTVHTTSAVIGSRVGTIYGIIGSICGGYLASRLAEIVMPAPAAK